MINKDRWISSLPKSNLNIIVEKNQMNHDKWINTVSKKNNHYPTKKYSLITIIFVCGLVFVSTVKNETRNLQKEINKLKTSIVGIESDLNQAILDKEVITSPQNISKLAKEYLDINLASYKRSQIKNLNDMTAKFNKEKELEKGKISNNKIKNLQANLKTQVARKIEKKKTEIKKLQELYQNPESIPKEIKTQVSKQIKEKKTGLKNVYNSPGEVITYERVSRWALVQVVKAFLGMPIVPGR